MKQERQAKWMPGFALAAGCLAALAAARGADIAWTNAAGGDFSNPLNWSPSQVPGPTDRAVFNIETPEPYTVIWSCPITNDSFVVDKGRLKWDLNGYRHEVIKVNAVSVYSSGFGTPGQTLDMVITNGVLNIAKEYYRSVLGATTVRMAANVTGTFGRYDNPGIGSGSRVIVDGAVFSAGGRLKVNAGGALTITNNGSLTLWSNYMVLEPGGRVCLTGENSYLYTAIGSQKIRGDFYIGDGAMARIGGVSGSATTIDGGRLMLNRGGVECFSSSTVYNELGSVEGQGVVTAALYNAGGWVRPGGTGGVGTLTNKGDFHNHLDDTHGTIEIELGGTAAGASDRLAVIGTLYAGGTLDVSFTGGFKPACKDAFDILDFTMASGTFDTVNLPGTAADWDLSELYTAGIIRYRRQGGTVLMVK